jgi:tetratricopeptide (TPR) repeat protein
MKQRGKTFNLVTMIALVLQFLLPAYANRYEECIDAINGDINNALEQAFVWRDAGGGVAARHCIALTLLAMGQEEEAALRLEELALEAGTGGPEERAELLAQAAQAWMRAGRPSEADVVLTSAIELQSSDPNLFVERALAHRMRQDWTSAITDLTSAIKLDRSLVDAYILRAAARRHTGDTIGASADVRRALELDPANVDAFLERGRQRELASGRDPSLD